MLDVIDLLERMGQDAQWSHASQDDIESALAKVVSDPAVRDAILSGDQHRTVALLDMLPLCGMLFPGKEDEEEDEDSEELPAGDDEEKPEHSLSHQQVPAN